MGYSSLNLNWNSNMNSNGNPREIYSSLKERRIAEITFELNKTINYFYSNGLYTVRYTKRAIICIYSALYIIFQMLGAKTIKLLYQLKPSLFALTHLIKLVVCAGIKLFIQAKNTILMITKCILKVIIHMVKHIYGFIKCTVTAAISVAQILIIKILALYACLLQKHLKKKEKRRIWLPVLKDEIRESLKKKFQPITNNCVLVFGLIALVVLILFANIQEPGIEAEESLATKSLATEELEQTAPIKQAVTADTEVGEPFPYLDYIYHLAEDEALFNFRDREEFRFMGSYVYGDQTIYNVSYKEYQENQEEAFKSMHELYNKIKTAWTNNGFPDHHIIFLVADSTNLEEVVLIIEE